MKWDLVALYWRDSTCGYKVHNHGVLCMILRSRNGLIKTADVTPSACNNRSRRALNTRCEVSDDTTARESESSFETTTHEKFNEPVEAATDFLIVLQAKTDSIF